MARVALDASPAVRARGEAKSILMSASLEEVRGNDRMKIEDKVGISSKMSNIQAFMEKIGDSLREDGTRTRLSASRKGIVTNSREGGAFLIIQKETGELASTETGKGRDEEHTYKDLHYHNSRIGPFSNLHLHGIGVLGLLSTMAS